MTRWTARTFARTTLSRLLPTFCCIGLSWISVQRGWAQSVPSLINYQGQVTDSAARPLETRDYVLHFSIWDAESGGSRIWGPQVFDGATGPGHGPLIPVVGGYFNVMLGPVDESNRSISSGFDDANRYVEITVADNPPIQPRQRVLSAPFAFRSDAARTAINSLSLGGRSSALYQARTDTGRVGVGTDAPSEMLHVSGGKALIQGRDLGPVDPDSYGSPSSGSLFDIIAQHPDGRAGLGIIQGVEIDSPVLWMSGHATNAFHVRRLPATAQPVSPARDGASLLMVRSDGNVGVGTTRPRARLEVEGAVMAQAFGDFRVLYRRTDHGGENPNTSYSTDVESSAWLITVSASAGGATATQSRLYLLGANFGASSLAELGNVLTRRTYISGLEARSTSGHRHQIEVKVSNVAEIDSITINFQKLTP